MLSCQRCLRALPARAGRAALYCRECRAVVRREQTRERYRRWYALHRAARLGASN